MTARTCTVRGCGRPLLAHGYCSTHVMRVRSRQSLAAPVREQRRYSDVEVLAAVDLATAVGVKPASRELGIPRTTLQQWATGRRRQSR